MNKASDNNLYSTYNRASLNFTHGEGVWLFDEAGEKYLDFAAGIAVSALGHGHPHLVKALQDQAARLWHTSNLYQVAGQNQLSERLCAATFADRVFFTNSGTEAIECAIKTARRYHFAKGHGERMRIITFEGAFHGRTLAAIAAGGQAKYLEGFGPKVQGFDQLPFGDHEALKAIDFSDVAAILVEPVQGEGGIRPLPSECLKGMRKLCDETGTLLIFDEIQCGVGRTGHLFAHEASEVTPDIMAIAKGMGAGFPVGACLATEEAAFGMKPGTHGTTYGGNPLAMAVGNAVLDVMHEDGFMDHIQDVSSYFWQGLSQLTDSYPDIIENVRGVGLMIGLKCKTGGSYDNIALVSALRDVHMLTVPAGDNVVRLLPPLNVTRAEVSEALTRLDKACRALSSAS